MNDKPKSKWYWRLLRWGLIGVAVLVTLAAVLVTEENWRGKHEWNAYRRAAEARGEKFDLAGIIPPAVPDDQNFFAAPFVAEALREEGTASGASASSQTSPREKKYVKLTLWRGDPSLWPTPLGDWQQRTLTDLKPWQTYFREYSQTPAGRTNAFPITAQPQSPAEDVLLAMSQFDPDIEALREASRRPDARLPLAYEKGLEQFNSLLPWLAVEKQWIQVLGLRVTAELQAGRSQAALDDVKLSLRLIGVTRDDPHMISHLVRVAMLHYFMQPIYEGIAGHRWNDAQLAELEASLAGQDFLADFRTAMAGDRIWRVATLETWRITREQKTYSGDQLVTNSLCWMPGAFFYQSELAIAQTYDRFVLPMADLTNRTVSLTCCRAGEHYIRDSTNHYSPYKILANAAFPSVFKIIVKFAIAQTDVDLARVACALERYRLAHGAYPESLDLLAPQFIAAVPHDVINGQPLHYRRTDDGGYVLYSVGWNETDDGGATAFKRGGSVDYEKGDWVWQLPAR